jgi:23S rRNA pseudouridine1911/1915/1917 synthase
MDELIPRLLAGERLDRVVAMLAGVSRAEAARLIETGAVVLDGAVATSGKVKVAEGQPVHIDVDVEAGPVEPEADASVAVRVVHADDAVIVIDKPAGLVVHPAAGNLTGTLVNGLLARYPEIAHVGAPGRPGIVHRLDKDTSGLLVVARTEAAYESLSEQFAAHTSGREYLALVWGHPASASGVVDAPIGRSARVPTRMAVSATGRAARTRYEVVTRYTDPVEVALVRCTLETGRTHQIRVHLSAIGHPVVGDTTYKGGRRALPVPRPLLHAARLAFDHPTTGERVRYSAPVPADMQAVLDDLG